jgi:hypothetical protein
MRMMMRLIIAAHLDPVGRVSGMHEPGKAAG